MSKVDNYFTLAYICDQAETGSGNSESGVEIVCKKELPPFQPGNKSNVAYQGHLVQRGNWAGTEIFELVENQDEDTWITVLKEPVSFHDGVNEGKIEQVATVTGRFGDEGDSATQRGHFIVLKIREGALMKEGRYIVHFLEHELNYRTPGFIFCVLDDSLQKQD